MAAQLHAVVIGNKYCVYVSRDKRNKKEHRIEVKDLVRSKFSKYKCVKARPIKQCVVISAENCFLFVNTNKY